MKTKLILSTDTKKFEYWTRIPFIPRCNESFNIQDILMENEIAEIKNKAHHWNGVTGIIQSVEYRHDDNDFYVEICIGCKN
jgi:hypothetical protein